MEVVDGAGEGWREEDEGAAWLGGCGVRGVGRSGAASSSVLESWDRNVDEGVERRKDWWRAPPRDRILKHFWPHGSEYPKQGPSPSQLLLRPDTSLETVSETRARIGGRGQVPYTFFCRSLISRDALPWSK